MLNSKLIYFSFFMLCAQWADILAYSIGNVVNPVNYRNYSSSDEKISRRELQLNWLPIGFCDSGMPLLKMKFCNGRKECLDGSDETMDRCKNNSCKNDQFRCTYGGCTSKLSVCDGIYNCADGSDEVYEVCQRNNCIIPYPTNDTVYYVPGCEKCSSGLSTKEGSILGHQCTKKGFSKADMPDVVCRSGIWIPNLPTCKSDIIEEDYSSAISSSGTTKMSNTPASTISSFSESTTAATPISWFPGITS